MATQAAGLALWPDFSRGRMLGLGPDGRTPKAAIRTISLTPSGYSRIRIASYGPWLHAAGADDDPRDALWTAPCLSTPVAGAIWCRPVLLPVAARVVGVTAWTCRGKGLVNLMMSYLDADETAGSSPKASDRIDGEVVITCLGLTDGITAMRVREKAGQGLTDLQPGFVQCDADWLGHSHGPDDTVHDNRIPPGEYLCGFQVMDHPDLGIVDIRFASRRSLY